MNEVQSCPPAPAAGSGLTARNIMEVAKSMQHRVKYLFVPPHFTTSVMLEVIYFSTFSSLSVSISPEEPLTVGSRCA